MENLNIFDLVAGSDYKVGAVAPNENDDQNAKVEISKSPVADDPDRLMSDEQKLRPCFRLCSAMSDDLAEIMAEEELATADGATIANVLSRTVLHRAQKILDRFAPGVICCLKVAVSQEMLRCYYPPQTRFLQHESVSIVISMG